MKSNPYFEGKIGFINETGRYAEYTVVVDIKETTNGHFVYSLGARKVKGTEQIAAPTLFESPGALPAPGSGLSPTTVSNDMIPQAVLEIKTPVVEDFTAVDDTRNAPNDNDAQYSFSDEEAASWEAYTKKYGVIPKGENPVRDVSVPKQTMPGTRVRRYVRTVLESNKVNKDMVNDIKGEVVRGAMDYTPISDKAATDYATRRMTPERIADAWSEWTGIANGKETPTKNGIALGEHLLAAAAERGDAAAVVRLTAELAEVATRAGQVVQAMRLLKKIGGVGQLYYIKRTVARMQQQLDNSKKWGKKGRTITIDPALAEALVAAKTDMERKQANEALLQSVADQVPSTFLDKWNAWR